MCDMVIDAGWTDSIDEGCSGGSCECGAMLGGGRSEPRGSKHGEWSCLCGSMLIRDMVIDAVWTDSIDGSRQ